jgi:hypothetical protein
MPIGDAENVVKSQRFKCDECAAELKFDAALGKLKCDHCGATRDVPMEARTVVEHDFFQGLANAPRGLGAGGATRTSRCQECGANVAFPDGVTATRCTFCGSSKVLEQSENQNVIRPESLVPFAIDKKRANQAFGDWLAKLWFRPGDLRRMAKVQEVAGIYVPFWTYDAHVESSWSAESGYYYFEPEEYTAEENGEQVIKVREVRRTRWELAWGHRGDDYDDVLVCGSVGLPRELADRFATFDTAELVPYSPGFLAGWRAEEYAVDLAQGFELAQQKMVREQQQRCARDVPGDTHRNLRVDNSFSAVTFKHVLLPVWIAAYRYRNRVFRFLVNGQTGEVVGKAPWSWLKLTLFAITLVAIVVILYLLFGRNR